jgi:hypothetical protein
MNSIEAIDLLLAARGGTDPPPAYLISILFGSAGILGGIALWASHQVSFLLAHAVYADGVVVKLEKVFGRGHQLCAPVFKFTACDELTYTIHSSIYSYPAEFQVGDSVRVIYVKDHPRNAQYVGLFAQWGVVIIFGCLALGLSLIGVGFLFFS